MNAGRRQRRSSVAGRAVAVGLALAAFLLGGCAADLPGPAGADRRRLDLLDQGFNVRSGDPRRAAELFADAGPGPVLERVRLEAWVDAVATSDADEGAWRRLLDDRLPSDLRARARLGLARRLVDDGRVDEAVSLLEGVPDGERIGADVELVGLDDGPWRTRAATRLAVAAPLRLRRAAPDLEPAAVVSLDPESFLARSAAWRAAGAAGRAAAELRRARWRGEQEHRRRLELARAELDAGSPTRAVGVLQGMSSDDPEVELIRGQAYRRQGWQRSPRPAAKESFVGCLHHARRATSAVAGSGAVRSAALQLVVECGTEVGRLDEALQAWWMIEALGWTGDRKEWLGRRLGVALALAGSDRGEIERLAGSLPDHARCLRFWAAIGSGAPLRAIEDLADPVFVDLYGLWVRELTSTPPTPRGALRPSIEPAAPPWSVEWLLERELVAEAASEWRRVRQARGTEPAEAIAEAGLAERRSRSNEVIGILRGAIPELGTVAMERAPENAVRGYLPLPWIAAVREAAAESGIEPWLVAGVARQESVFVPYARSPAGAVGVMQLLPGTARGHARALGLGDRPDLEQADLNLRLGARELRRLLDRFGAVEPALAAYNAGETRARRWWRDQPDRFRFTEAIPIPETYGYVRRVRFLAEAYRVAYDREWRMPP